MASKSNTIVRGYFERVSWRVLDRHRPIVRELIRGHAGVYALYKGERLYYVGLASNLMGRVNTHLKDRHKGRWDRFSVYLTTDDAHIRPLEALMLRVSNPVGNAVKGRLRGAQDLVRTLKRRMDEYDEATRRRRCWADALCAIDVAARPGATRGSLVLARLVERPMHLIGEYKGIEYRASLRRDGHISYRGKLYDSPTGAAKAAIGRGVRGWLFWHYRNSKGQWVKLSDLKH